MGKPLRSRYACTMRRLLFVLLGLTGIALAAAGFAWRSAMADPQVRLASVSLADWPRGAPPVRIALLSDLHVGNAVTDDDRLTRIVAQVNALRPDLIVLAGDFVAGHAREDAGKAGALAPLAGLRASLGTVAVLGNHDHWVAAARVRRVLERAGVTVLANAAIRRGPLALGGVDDMVTRHDDLRATLVAAARVGGARVLLSHSPDLAPRIPGGLLIAGHTHCGQVVLPLYGPLVDVSRYGARYRCGVVREGARTTVVGAGIGTSVAPFRLGAPPDLWLVRVGP